MTHEEWHKYITQTPHESFESSPDYAAYQKISSQLQMIYALLHGDLREKNVAKRIVQERTQPVATSKGYPPYAFRFQCLTTGRKSRFIKVADYQRFGITQEDAQHGNGYPEVSYIRDKTEPYRSALSGQLRAILNRAFGSSDNLWWRRYNEYLQSEEWAELREHVIHRDNYACVITGLCDRLHVHHLTYRNVGNESLDELVTLCSDVHTAIHDRVHNDYEKFTTALSHYIEVRSKGMYVV